MNINIEGGKINLDDQEVESSWEKKTEWKELLFDVSLKLLLYTLFIIYTVILIKWVW
jgi:hypothetical protein